MTTTIGSSPCGRGGTFRFTDKDGNETERIELKLKTCDKIGALRELGKHLGVAQRIDHGGEIITTAREMTDEELLKRANQLANRVAAHVGGNGTGPSKNGGG